MVTGANRGIGRAVAEGLAAEGAIVAVCARRMPEAEEAARAIGRGAFAVALDVADDEQCRDAVALVAARAGALHVLVNNAAVAVDEDHATADLPQDGRVRIRATHAR